MTSRPIRPLLPVLLVGLACLALGALGSWFWQARLRSDPAARLAAGDRAAIEAVVHDYLMTHPEILPKALEALERRGTADRLGAVRAEVERAHPGVVLGNPRGTVTLVEFTDYACGYCRGSVADVDALIAANPDLRVVVRELPILTPESADAARMAIAAGAQGRYAAFHKAMFAAGRPNAETIAAAARSAGLDMAKAQQTIAMAETKAELARNLELARSLGLDGTPSWVIGDVAESGAIGRAALGEAIARARRGARG